MTYLALLLISAFVWSGLRFFYKPLHRVPWLIITVNIAICTVLASLAYALIAYANTLDWEIHNGYVTSKEIDRRDCDYPGWRDWPDSFCTNENTRRVFSHYETVCDSEGKNCRQEKRYKTQYSYDYPWEQKFYVYSSLSDSYRIDRVDDQGAKTPPRYEIVQQGDPISKRSTYQNHLLNATHSLLNPQNTAVDPELYGKVPEYPGNIFDYYKMNRLITIGISVDTDAWNSRISYINSKVGHSKQANLIVVLTSESQEIRNAIYKRWNGGKKNDVIVILGVVNNVVEWSDGITFLNNKGNEFLISNLSKLHDQPLSIDMLNFIHENISKSFDRVPMASVKYLADSYVPDASVFLWSLVALLFFLVFSFFITKANYSHSRY